MRRTCYFLGFDSKLLINNLFSIEYIRCLYLTAQHTECPKADHLVYSKVPTSHNNDVPYNCGWEYWRAGHCRCQKFSDSGPLRTSNVGSWLRFQTSSRKHILLPPSWSLSCCDFSVRVSVIPYLSLFSLNYLEAAGDSLVTNNTIPFRYLLAALY